MNDGTATAATELDADQRAGKYLTFFLKGEEYGIEILKVREIVEMMEVTPVPISPPYIRGMVNLRGRVVPVLDLRLKFGMEAGTRSSETCIIVVEAGEITMGLVVDRVSEVVDIAALEIEDVPNFGIEISTEYILGVGKSEAGIRLLLDIEKVLTPEEEAFAAAVQETEVESEVHGKG